MRTKVTLGLVVVALALCVPAGALALPAPAGVQQGRAVQAAQQTSKAKGSAPCHTGIPVIGGAISKLCGVAEEAAGAVSGVVGGAVKAAGEGIMSVLANWMIAAATTITAFVARQMRDTTTPQLDSAWFAAQYRSMADLGAALGLLVALIALASAAVRRSPEALAATLAGIVRAGLGTTLAVALTVIGLDVADQISSAVLASSTQSFWSTVSHAWSASSFGGFGSSALAMLIALVEVLAALFVWLELIARDAAIYLAVLFVPVILAASIWPALGSWIGRLARLLLLIVAFKPVALIVLSFAGSAAAAGLSFSEGISTSVGTILVATVIFCLAAFAPWTLMFLLAADADSAHTAAGMRTAAGAAVAGSSGRSLRTAGGLRNPGAGGRSGGRGHSSVATDSSAFAAAGGAGGGDGAGGSSGPGGDGAGPGGGSGPGGQDPAGGGGGASAPAGEDDGTLAVGAETVGAGSVAAAAGIAASATSASEGEPGTPASGSQPAEPRGAQTIEEPSGASSAGEPPVRAPALAGSSSAPRHAGDERTRGGDAQRQADAQAPHEAGDPGQQHSGAAPLQRTSARQPEDIGQDEPRDTPQAREQGRGGQGMVRSPLGRGARRLRLVATDANPTEDSDQDDGEGER